MAVPPALASIESPAVATRRTPPPRSRNKARVNIRDVAERANVSIGTVSLAINNRPGISEKTRDQVLRVVEEMGYVPSLIGRAINRCSAGVLGVLMPVAHSPLFGSMVAGINDESEDERKMPIFVSYSRDRAAVEARMLRIFSQMRIDGLLFAAAPDSDNIDLARELFPEHDVPVVQVERQAVGLASDFVGSENRHAAMSQTLRLLDAGYDGVGIVMTGHQLSTAEERYMGWRDALRQAGLEPREDWVCWLDRDETIGSRTAFTRLLEDRGFPRAMIWCAGDTAVVPHVLNATGRVNGQEIEVVLFDADPQADFAGQRFTHVEQDGYQIGRAAAKLLLQRCDEAAAGGAAAPSRREVRFPCQVFEAAEGA